MDRDDALASTSPPGAPGPGEGSPGELGRAVQGSSGGAAAVRGPRPRLDALDALRGLVMVWMALDHARDWFSPAMNAAGQFLQPEDLPNPPPVLFLTRWITHFCAPVFVLLAGVGAWLYGSRPGRTRGQVSRFLATRGLWLIALELTVVLFGWGFRASPGFFLVQVIGAIGASMLLLSLACRLPRAAVFLMGALIVAGHNLLDGTPLQEDALAQAFPPYAEGTPTAGLQLYMLLRVPALVFPPGLGVPLLVGYPLLPWFGLLCLGWSAGPIFQRAAPERRRACLLLGAALTAAFLFLRASNLYGDPQAWSRGGGFSASVISFLNVEKYPPSLSYILMTIGPAFLVLPLLERLAPGVARPLVTFGRVPLFYYVAHLYLLHGMQRLSAFARFGSEGAAWSLFGGYPTEYPLPLAAAYAAWIVAVAALYPLCRWFAGVKARSRAWWLSYL